MNSLPTIPLFRAGQIVATPGALALLEQANKSPLEFLSRPLRGDWAPSQVRSEARTRTANGAAANRVKNCEYAGRKLPICAPSSSSDDIKRSSREHQAGTSSCVFTMESSARMQAATSAILRRESFAGGAPIRDWLPSAENEARSRYRQ
jgi:hypothetical protein